MHAQRKCLLPHDTSEISDKAGSGCIVDTSTSISQLYLEQTKSSCIHHHHPTNVHSHPQLCRTLRRRSKSRQYTTATITPNRPTHHPPHRHGIQPNRLPSNPPRRHGNFPLPIHQRCPSCHTRNFESFAAILFATPPDFVLCSSAHDSVLDGRSVAGVC